MASLKGKVIAITGGASGIGLATAKLLASRGAKVSVTDLHPDLENVAKSIIETTGNMHVIATKVDVRDTSSVSGWIEQTVKEFGQLDGAANVAGVYKGFDDKTVADEDEKNWQFMLDVNLTGVMHCMRSQVPHIRRGGSVVNAASILATRGWAGASAYSASKHGVVGLIKSAAKEVGKDGIRVNCIAP
jgi:NAD(P)-dependent dehydrogenase (short-subunit alcohol dehydrogenase family)